jgi:WD40 repeat protein
MFLSKKLNILLSLLLVSQVSLGATAILLEHPKPPISTVNKNVTKIKFLEKKNKLITGGSWTNIFVWDSETGKMESSIPIDEVGWTSNFIINEHANLIAFTGNYSNICVFDLDTYKKKFTFISKSDPSCPLYPSFCFSGDGTRLLAQKDELVQIWDTQTGSQLYEFISAERFVFRNNTTLLPYVEKQMEYLDLNSGEFSKMAELSVYNYIQEICYDTGKIYTLIVEHENRADYVQILEYDIEKFNFLRSTIRFFLPREPIDITKPFPPIQHRYLYGNKSNMIQIDLQNGKTKVTAHGIMDNKITRTITIDKEILQESQAYAINQIGDRIALGYNGDVYLLKLDPSQADQSIQSK